MCFEIAKFCSIFLVFSYFNLIIHILLQKGVLVDLNAK